MTDRRNEIIQSFTQQYIAHLSGLASNGPRTYGFEYEFLPRVPFSPDDMRMVISLLPDIGFIPDGADFKSENGLRVNFEPGGQIEYNSPPLFAQEDERFRFLLAAIDHTNLTIRQRLGILHPEARQQHFERDAVSGVRDSGRHGDCQVSGGTGQRVGM
ncbi:MAG: hypothetical protein M0Z56_12630 [Desulfobacteraceae bacterium]|nr:hypothetical protein [Desulfobacteraceae bacterium]